jgi:sortase (surface protein transpeptidase)
MEEVVIKHTRKGDVEIPVSTPEICIFCGTRIPISEHATHDLESHMPKMPMCVIAAHRTFTPQEKEHFYAANRPV